MPTRPDAAYRASSPLRMETHLGRKIRASAISLAGVAASCRAADQDSRRAFNSRLRDANRVMRAAHRRLKRRVVVGSSLGDRMDRFFDRSIRRESTARWWKTGEAGRPAQQSRRQMELIENNLTKQWLAMKVRSRLRVICATPFRKRRGRQPFRAVPLLRVQSPSVIVMLRRRGASRGRPVLGGSLKSLAFMRECPKARSD